MGAPFCGVAPWHMPQLLLSVSLIAHGTPVAAPALAPVALAPAAEVAAGDVAVADVALAPRPAAAAALPACALEAGLPPTDAAVVGITPVVDVAAGALLAGCWLDPQAPAPALIKTSARLIAQGFN